MTIIKTIQDFKSNIAPNSNFWYFVYDNNQPIKIEKATILEYLDNDEISLKDGFFADFNITPKIEGFLVGSPVYTRKDSAQKAFARITQKQNA